MTFKSILAGCAFAALLATQAHASTLLNPSFEAGDLTDWSSPTPGLVTVIEGTADALGGAPFGEDFGPTDGRYFVQVEAGSTVGAYTVLRSADFTLDVQSELSLDAAFLAFDYGDYNDGAYVQVIGPANAVLFLSSVQAVGDLGHTPWTNVSGTLAAGTYHLEAGVRNVGEEDGPADMTYASRLLIDNVRVAGMAVAAVPEPETWALLLTGFFGVGALIRRRRFYTL